jgi:hypothetical protein
LEVDGEFVDAVAVEFEVVVEDGVNADGLFCECGDGCEEVAVSDVALLYICGFDVVFDHNGVFDDFAHAFPNDGSAFYSKVEGFLVGGEEFVDEGSVGFAAVLEVFGVS